MLRIQKKYYLINLKNGLRIKLRSSTADRGIVKEVFLMGEYSKCAPFIKKADSCLDIGAQIGCFSLYAKRLNPSIKKVLSFEPASENYGLLKENIQLNNLGKVIIPINLALSDKKDKLKLYLSKENSGGHSLLFKTDRFETVDVESINNIFKQKDLGEKVFMKLDCEGGEYSILMGLTSNFKKVNALIMEYHDKAKLKEIIQKLSFEGFQIKLDKNYSVLLAYK